VQAIRGLPLFCKDTPEHIAKIVDILVQLLAAGKLLLCIVYSVVFFFLLFYAVAEPTIYVFIFGWGVGGSKIMMIKICVLHNVFHKSNSNNMQIKAIFFF
jgi:hypothetical protein